MANFNKESTKRFIKDILSIDNLVFQNKNYLDNILDDGSIDEERMKELFGEKGFDCIKELIEFSNQLSRRHAPSEPSIRQVITAEIYNKFTPEELNGLSVNEIVDDARIDWNVIINALESRYIDKADADNAKKSIKLIIGRNLGEESSFARANLNQINNAAERTLLKEENAKLKDEADRAEKRKSFWKKGAIGGMVATGASAIAVVTLAILLARSNTKVQNIANQYETNNANYANYVTAELAELNAFEDILAKLGVDGISDLEAEQLKEEIVKHQATDSAEYDYSSTSEMNSRLDAAIKASQLENLKTELADLDNKYDDIEQKYQDLLSTSAPTFNHIQFLSDVQRIQDMLITALADNSFTDVEKQMIKDEIVKINTYSDAIAQQVADKLGVSVDQIYNSLDYQIASANTQISTLRGEVANLNNVIADKDNTLALKDNEIKDLNSKVSSLETQIKNLEQLVDDLRLQISNSSSNTALNAQLQQALTDLATLRQEYDILHTSYSNLVSENSQLTTENNSLKAENITLNSTIVGLNTDISNLNNQVNDLNSQVGTLQANIQNLTNENSQLKTDNDTLSQHYASLLADYDNLEADYDKIVADYNAKVSEYNTLLDDYQELQDKLNDSTDAAEIARLEKELDEATKALLQAKSDLEAASQKISELETKVADLEAKVQELVSQASQGNSDFIISLYESLGRDSTGKTIEEIVNELSQMFDLDINVPTIPEEEMGSVPIK